MDYQSSIKAQKEHKKCSTDIWSLPEENPTVSKNVQGHRGISKAESKQETKDIPIGGRKGHNSTGVQSMYCAFLQVTFHFFSFFVFLTCY
jgi:hypothetical protein